MGGAVSSLPSFHLSCDLGEVNKCIGSQTRSGNSTHRILMSASASVMSVGVFYALLWN